MIAKTTSAPSFFPLAAYLEAGTDGLHPERVEWTAARHLATSELTVAPAIMQATAFQSAQVERPCYHLVIAFDVGDRPTRAQMEHVADAVLGRLGLADHQALLVAHNDRLYAHVHVMVNRVHPETGVAWERWKDRHVIEAALRDAEHALGFREVPGTLAPGPDRAPVLDLEAASLTPGERRLADRLAYVPLLDRARDALPNLRAARNWGDFEIALARSGLTAEHRPRGLVFSDGQTRVSGSRVASELSLGALERRFGERYHDPAPPPQVERLAEEIRQLAKQRELERDTVRAGEAHQAALYQVDAAVRAADRHRAHTRDLDRSFARIYTDPRAARTAFDALVARDGVERATQVLTRAPEGLGRLTTVPTAKALGLMRGADDKPAREEARLTTPAARTYAESLAAQRDSASRGPDLETVTGAARHMHAAQSALTTHRATHGHASKLERAIGEAMLRLLPPELQRLQLIVTAPDLALALFVKDRVRDTLSHGDGRSFSSEVG